MAQIKYFYEPKSIKEAKALINKNKGKTTLLAGGTSLSMRLPQNAESIISLRSLPLKDIVVNAETVSIGAMAKLVDIIKNKKLKDPISALFKEASAKAANTPLQNLITVGGNLTQVYSWSNLPLVAIAADVNLILLGDKKQKSKAKEFFLKHPVQQLKNGEILSAVEFPKVCKGVKRAGAFIKFSLTESDYSILSACIFLSVEKGKIKSSGVVAGAISALPQILKKSEDFLVGKALRDIDTCIDEFGSVVASEIQPKDDVRFSMEYKREISKSIFERTLQKAIERL